MLTAATAALDQIGPEEEQAMEIEIKLRSGGRGKGGGKELDLLVIVAEIFIEFVFVDQEVGVSGRLVLVIVWRDSHPSASTSCSTSCVEQLCEV
jgi:hypothetical protein